MKIFRATWKEKPKDGTWNAMGKWLESNQPTLDDAINDLLSLTQNSNWVGDIVVKVPGAENKPPSRIVAARFENPGEYPTVVDIKDVTAVKGQKQLQDFYDGLVDDADLFDVLNKYRGLLDIAERTPI